MPTATYGLNKFQEPPATESASLTHYEIKGLNGAFSLADGHAVHEWTNVEKVFTRVNLYSDARHRGVVTTSREMLSSWALLAKEPHAPSSHYFIGLTASVSIDIVAAAAKQRGKRIVLIEPTFDNLSQIIKRRGVPLSVTHENRLHDDMLKALAVLGRQDVLFLVDPNNPTGLSYDEERLEEIFAICAHRGISVIVDRTFRFYGAQVEEDLVGRLKRAGVSFVVIEDTGKTWPTLEMKVSPTFYSTDWREAIEEVFEEIFLSPSPFSMQFFADLFEVELASDFHNRLSALVGERREKLRSVISGTPLRVAPESAFSKLPVEWIDLSGMRVSDVDLVNDIAVKTGVHLLPGRQFYWSRGCQQPDNRIRVSLLRQQHVFEESLIRLAAYFRENF